MKRFPILAASLVLFAVVDAPRVTAQDDHGHDHGAATAGHAEGAEMPTVAVTQWTDTMELFMEYPEMIARQPGRFIIHLTILDGFQPVRAGKVTLAFTGSHGTREVHSADSLLREGIFAPELSLNEAGVYGLDLTYEGPGVSSTFRIREFTVHASAASIHAHADEPGDGIAFLKEQQWKIPFSTAPAVEREIRQSVWAIAEVLPAPAGYMEIVAPVDGVIQAGSAGDLALPGAAVKRGSTVARIAPTLQGNGWTESELAYVQAERNLERARRLREKDAISDREFEEAENEFQARQAGRQRLSGTGANGVLNLAAPIAGRIMDWQVRPGQYVRAGDRLMTIVDPDVVWLQANVYEADFRGLGTPVGVFVNAGGDEGGWTIPQTDLQVLSTGGALDPATRTIPVLLEIDNASGRLSINESVPVELVTSLNGTGLAVPRSAVYRDDGVDVVFAQIGGESFAKRIVRTGPHFGEWVTILEGLRPGDRVVTRGGYHVKLASTTTEIGHGHAH